MVHTVTAMKPEILLTGRAIAGPAHWPINNGSPINGWLLVPLLACTLLLLAACGTTAVPTDTPAAEAPVAIVPVTATPDPDYVPPQTPLRPLPLPTVNSAERESAGSTWLYLAAFQNDFVSVVDPISGHALRQIPVNADQAGMAVSPDGTRLYVADWLPAQDGQLRVFDTATWRVVHREPVPDLSRLLGGNPITLSPNGRWLVLGFYDYQRLVGWHQIFDTQSLEFLPEEKWQLGDCGESPLRLFGQPDDKQLYVQCHGFVAALRAENLSPIWRIPSPTPFGRDSLGWPTIGKPYLAVSRDGKRLYGLYPRIERKPAGSSVPVVGTDLQLLVWETGKGERLQEVMMSDQVSVPLLGASGRSGGYLTVSPDGQRVFIAWEDMLWALDGESLRVLQELRLPAPVDGMVRSVDGRDLYLLPSTWGDLSEELRGMITVDSTTLKLLNHADDWPGLRIPFFFAAPAARQQ